jgi:predicted GTPase
MEDFVKIGSSLANHLIVHNKKPVPAEETRSKISNATENIMRLGYTGAGKSTIINYLFGEKIVETGTGKPVTKKVEFKKITIPSPLRKGIDINFFDSWGLESNKADEWKKIIHDKLLAGFDFDNIIHGVVYCFSYNKDRIENFELELLEELMRDKYKLVIAFTQADSKRYDERKGQFREIISNRLDKKYRDDYVMVDVCAEPVKKLGQKNKMVKFGKEELLEQIERNIFDNIIGVTKTI